MRTLMAVLLCAIVGCGGTRSASPATRSARTEAPMPVDACDAQGRPVSDWGWGAPIMRPLTVAKLSSETMLVYTDLWSVRSEPDTLLLLPNGTVSNRRAGLDKSSWRLVDDTTVAIGRSIFRHRRDTCELFDGPLEDPPKGKRFTGTVIRGARRF